MDIQSNLWGEVFDDVIKERDLPFRILQEASDKVYEYSDGVISGHIKKWYDKINKRDELEFSLIYYSSHGNVEERILSISHPFSYPCCCMYWPRTENSVQIKSADKLREYLSERFTRPETKKIVNRLMGNRIYECDSNEIDSPRCQTA